MTLPRGATETSAMPDSDYQDHFYTSADDLTLYARDYPGPEDSGLLPVLCMHGLTRNSADFAWIAGHLARTRRVISAAAAALTTIRHPQTIRRPPMSATCSNCLMNSASGACW